MQIETCPYESRWLFSSIYEVVRMDDTNDVLEL